MSGGLFDRPAMNKLIAYLDQYPHEKFEIVFDDLKRFARDTLVHFRIKSELMSRGVKIECLNYKFDESPEGQFIETIMAAQSQLEREQNKRQVIQKQRARMEKGYWCLCAPTRYKFIYSPEHGKVIKPQEPIAAILKNAIEKYASNQLITLDEVRTYIEQQYKIYCIEKKSSINGVRRILSKPIYAGYLEYDPWQIPLIKSKHEGIITIEQFNIIQDKLNGRTRKHLRKDYSLDFPLRGYVVCDSCKGKFTASWNTGRNKRYANYTCKTTGCIFQWQSVRKEKIEPEFEAMLSRYKPQPQHLDFVQLVLKDQWQERTQNRTKYQRVNESEIEALQAQIDSLVIRISKATSDNVISVYEKQIDELMKQQEELRENSQETLTEFDFGTALDEIIKYVENPLEWWKRSVYNDKAMLLQTLFDGNLSYDLNSGFGTINLSLPAKVFLTEEGQKINLVEMAGIEPASEL